MFKEKTVFVLGAGASAEFNMPVGSKLKKTIATKLNFGKPANLHSDKIILSALKKANNSVSVKTTGQFLRAINTYDTIDEFLSSNPDDKEFQLCGKLAIVKSILDAEAKSKLANEGSDNKVDYSFLIDHKDRGTFLGSLVRQLNKGIKNGAFDKLFHNVSFINFNYDRCLERGLVLGLTESFPFDDVPDGEFNQWVKSAKILRPYGSVGSHWPDEDNHVPFGGWEFGSENEKAEKLIGLVDGIKTFSENENQIDNADLIKEEMFAAKKIVFLGFHFYPQNLNLLSPGSEFRNPSKVFHRQEILATVYQRSPSDKERLKQIFKNFALRTENKVIFEDGKCYALFHNNQLAF